MIVTMCSKQLHSPFYTFLAAFSDVCGSAFNTKNSIQRKKQRIIFVKKTNEAEPKKGLLTRTNKDDNFLVKLQQNDVSLAGAEHVYTHKEFYEVSKKNRIPRGKHKDWWQVMATRVQALISDIGIWVNRAKGLWNRFSQVMGCGDKHRLKRETGWMIPPTVSASAQVLAQGTTLKERQTEEKERADERDDDDDGQQSAEWSS